MTAPDIYKVVAFLDTNIILEGKPLADLPWGEVDGDGPILAVVTPTTLKEVDRRKRDGRLGERARAFNRFVAAAATNGEVLRVHGSVPVVDLAVAICGRLDWDGHEYLERDDPDARIVAEALAAEQGRGGTKVMVSQDLNPIALARRAGLQTKHVSSEWLLPKEPSPAEKDIMRLQQRVRELSINEPSLVIEIDGPTGPIPIFDVAPIPEPDAYRYQQNLIGREPRRKSDWLSYQTDHSFDERYERYRDTTVPAFVQSFHKKVAASYAQVPIAIRLVNEGSIRADRLVINVRCQGGTIHDRFALVSINGPVVPEPRSMMDAVRQNIRLPTALVGKHEIHVEIETQIGSTELEVHCEDFRHSREWRWEGFATLDAHDRSPMTIEVRATAANLHGAAVKQLRIDKVITPKELGELVDLEKRAAVVRIPFPAPLEEALENKDFRLFEFMDQEEPED